MSELTFTLLRLGYLVLLWLLVVFAIRVMRHDLADKPGPAPATTHADYARGAHVVAPHHAPEPLPEAAATAAATPAPVANVASVAAPAPVVGTPVAGVPRTSFRSTLSSDPSPAPAGTPHAAPPPSAAHAATGAATGPRRLLVTEGVLRGTSLPLTSSAILIGRAPSCTLVLDDDYSSSRHARIFPQNGYWYVEDLGSTNGTFVDGRRIEAPVAVHPGEHITVGQTTMELQR
jgi:hypothetical protein